MPGDPAPGASEPGPPPRDRAPIAVLAVFLLVSIALVVGIVLLLDDDSDTSAGPTPTVTDGGGATYRIEVADDPEPSEASPEGTHFALTATITVSPPEIDAGTTIEVNVDDVVARFDDGAPIAVAISQPQTIRIDDRGEPDSVVIAAADSTGGFFYIVDMLFPAIPPDVESEGDTWPISFEADVPAGSGTATYEGTGELVRFEDVGGVEAAVIRNDLTFTYDITMHASEVAALSGLGAASTGTADVTGTGEMTLTGWVDRTTGRVLRTEFEGTYDTVFRYQGFDPEALDLEGDYPSRGSFTGSTELSES